MDLDTVPISDPLRANRAAPWSTGSTPKGEQNACRTVFSVLSSSAKDVFPRLRIE